MSRISFFLVVIALGNVWHGEACRRIPPATETTASTVSPTADPTAQPSPAANPTTKEPTTAGSSAPTTTEARTSTSSTTTPEPPPTSTTLIYEGCNCPNPTEYTESRPSYYNLFGDLTIVPSKDANSCSQVTLTCTAIGNYEVFIYPSFNSEISILPHGAAGNASGYNCGSLTVETGYDDVPLVCKEGSWHYVDPSYNIANIGLGCAYSNEVNQCIPV